jgi:hypothetical protein
MNTQATYHTTTLDSFLFTHARALIQYASTDHAFAESLAAFVKTLPYQETNHPAPSVSGHYFVLPHSQTEAVAAASWLLRELQAQPARSRHTTALLHAWAEPYKAPKDQIFGIVGIAIIGPTLGLIKSKKKKKSQMQVIVNRAWSEHSSPAELLNVVQKVSQGVVAKELRLAGGDVYRLHPDTAEWCLADPVTKLYHDSETELTKLEAAAQEESLSFATYKKESKTIALALSPTVNESFAADFSLTTIS